ncbi:MAG: aldehyde dehydrogenase family protein [Pseudomonadota bacterium]
MNEILDLMNTMDYGPAPESAGIAHDWLARHEAGFGLFINGAFTAVGGKTRDIRNPANGETLARTTDAGQDDVDAAVAAARKAQKGWADLGGHGRARHLYALARHVQQHARLLAVLETMDNGKPIRESRDIDVPLVARHFYHHAGWAELLEDEFPGARPVGVCGQVIPWNFPLLMLAWKIAPALAAGNTVVLKPAEFTPLTALAFAEICVEAGVPAGVVNIVTGGGETGALVAGHTGVDKVAFTGSTDVGRIIRRQIAGSGKKLTLELGGKSPFVVFQDADLDAAVEGVVDAIWFNQGEVCCAGSRILVQESVADAFTAKLRRRMETLRVGDPLDKNTDIGAIVDPVQVDRITDLVARGTAEGASLIRAPGAIPKAGSFYPPTIACDVAPASILMQEEIFGPVATLSTFRTPDEAIALANNTRYGLAAAIWSENINLALDIAAKVKAGVVWINATNIFDAAAGFGGYRESGFGREGGKEGMYAYLTWPAPKPKTPEPEPEPLAAMPGGTETGAATIDRTAKLYIGGKQARPDSGYVYPVAKSVGLAGLGNRKDIRNAVEAAHKTGGWGAATGHNRAQVLYYLAENLAAREAEFADRLRSFGIRKPQAEAEVAAAIQRAFYYAAWSDKFDGMVHQTKSNHVTLAMNEPLGVIGIACPTAAPLAGFLSLVLPAIAMGNAVVAVPSQSMPLAATDLYQVLETSDVPAGVVNIVTGPRDELAKVLAEHDDVAAMWYFGTAEGAEMVETASAGNLKQTWVEDGAARDWTSSAGASDMFLRRATQVKNIWVPYGE